MTIRKLLLAAGTVFLLAACASADTVNMHMVGAGPTSLGGAFIGPYTATINGVSTPVTCDDFLRDT
jgi:hypothetical protein